VELTFGGFRTNVGGTGESIDLTAIDAETETSSPNCEVVNVLASVDLQDHIQGRNSTVGFRPTKLAAECRTEQRGLCHLTLGSSLFASCEANLSNSQQQTFRLVQANLELYISSPAHRISDVIILHLAQIKPRILPA